MKVNMTLRPGPFGFVLSRQLHTRGSAAIGRTPASTGIPSAADTWACVNMPQASGSASAFSVSEAPKPKPKARNPNEAPRVELKLELRNII
jgi:hypothetical protein